MDLFKDPVPVEPKKSTTAVEQIIKAIKNMIIEQNLRVGDKIPSEFELSALFQKSRGCVREAVKILDSYGVLEVRRGDGTYVRASASHGLFDAQFFRIIAMGTKLSELIQLRYILESGIIRAAIERVGHQELSLLRDAEVRLQASLDARASIERTVADDVAFHTVLVEITGNEMLKNVYTNMLDIFIPYIQYSHEQQQATRDFSVLPHHDLIIRAVAERDYDLAQYAVRNALKDWKRLNESYKKEQGE